MSDFDFSTLSPDLILDGLESAGFSIASGLLPLNSYENRVYQFTDDDNQKFVTKFYRPNRWTKAQIEEELAFACELETNELPVVAPLNREGKTLFEHQGFYFSVYPCRGGRIFEVDNLDQLEWMGRFVGRIHALGAKNTFEHRPSLNQQEFLIDARDIIASSDYVPMHLETPFFTILDQVVGLVREQHFDSNYIRLHGDCHAGNILWTDDGPHFVDLDDCRMGPAIQDIWMMLSGDRQQQLLQLDTILSGYEEFYPFEHKQLKLVESLRSMRVIHYMAWLTRRWSDPAFPRNFPWFNTEKYWEQQILMLKEQYAALQEPALSLIP